MHVHLEAFAVAWDGEVMPFARPECGAGEGEVLGGDELALESIECRG